MAQHRTKREKIEAQHHRLEKNLQYSLSDLDLPKTKSIGGLTSDLIPPVDQRELHYVQIDLKKTCISTLLVCVLLAVGAYVLH